MPNEPFDIRSDIEVPDFKGRSKYPFRQMKVGDSFGFPEGNRRNVEQAACQFGRRNGQKFAVRKHPDHGLRCWRIA